MMYKKLINISFVFLLIGANYTFSQQLIGENKYTDSSVTVTFSFVGDLMCHSTQFNYARQNDSTFNFKPVFREIKKYFDNSDVVIGNLETVVFGDEINYSGYPVFNTPEDFLKGLNYAGFDILVTANNHIYDQRGNGVVNTLDFIQKNEMKSSGAYKTQTERDSVKLFEKSGLKFAILSYTYAVNLYKIPKKNKFMVNLIDSKLIKSDIEKAKDQNADLIIVYFHFGSEYSRSENNYQKNIVEKAISYGADVIIGAHPHTLQPIEFYETNNANIDSGFVAYSLGNFVSNQRWRYSDGGTVLNFSVTKNISTNKSKLDAVRYLPIWVFKGVTNRGLEYVVIPSDIANSDTYPSYFNDEDKKLMLECYTDTREIIESRTNRIELDSIDKSSYRKWIMEQAKFRDFIAKIPYKLDCSQRFLLKTDSLQYISFNE